MIEKSHIQEIKLPAFWSAAYSGKVNLYSLILYPSLHKVIDNSRVRKR